MGLLSLEAEEERAELSFSPPYEAMQQEGGPLSEKALTGQLTP